MQRYLWSLLWMASPCQCCIPSRRREDGDAKVPSRQGDGYLRGVLQEADIRAGLEAGGRIENVVIIARRDEADGVEHVPYLLPSWRRGYVAIGLFRGAGVRAYRDLTRLVRFLRDDLGFHGPISLHEESCSKLAKLRSFIDGAAPAGSTQPDQPQSPSNGSAAPDTLDT